MSSHSDGARDGYVATCSMDDSVSDDETRLFHSGIAKLTPTTTLIPIIVRSYISGTTTTLEHTSTDALAIF